MKRTVLIFILFIPFVGACQSEEKIIVGKVFSKLPEYYKNKFDTVQCMDFIEIGKRTSLKDSFFLPSSYIALHTTTFKEILKREYNIFENNIFTNDVIIPESQCFDEYMFLAINKKQGDSFLGRIEKKADSLDKAGMGYKEPLLANKSNLIDVFKDKFKYIADFMDNDQLTLFIAFDVNKEGKPKNIRVYEGDSRTHLILSEVNTSSKYRIEVLRVISETKWEPAKLYGKPIESNQHLLLNKVK